jgi:hypothetical protein
VIRNEMLRKPQGHSKCRLLRLCSVFSIASSQQHGRVNKFHSHCSPDCADVEAAKVFAFEDEVMINRGRPGEPIAEQAVVLCLRILQTQA